MIKHKTIVPAEGELVPNLNEAGPEENPGEVPNERADSDALTGIEPNCTELVIDIVDCRAGVTSKVNPEGDEAGIDAPNEL